MEQSSHIPLIELRLLHYFVAVAAELNYRRAAKRLHISAPSLSSRIKQLETMLEVRLLDRDTNHVRLTTVGEVLLHEARSLLEHERQLVANIKEAAARESADVLRLGHFGSFSQHLFSEALDTYHMRFPKVGITLTELAVENEQAEALGEGRIQVGFVFGDRLRQMKDIGHLLVFDIPVCAVMGARHPLAALEEVGMAELVEYPLLSTPSFHKRFLIILARLGKVKSMSAKIRISENFNAIISSLIAEKSVILMPKAAIVKQNPKLALRPIKDFAPGPRMQIYAAWKKVGATPQALNFIEVLREIGVQHE